MSKRLLLKELSRYNLNTWADIIYRNALLHPDKEALIYGNLRITFSEFNKRVNKLVHAINKFGLKKGDTVGIISWNCQQALDLYGTCMKGGFIASPFNTRLTVEELDYVINYSNTSVLFVGPELVETVNALKPRIPKVKEYIIMEGSAGGMISYDELMNSQSDEEPDIELNENDPVCIIYTSGTTGVPRGALYTHSRFIDDSRTLAIDLGLQSYHKHLQITPQFHIAGHTWFRSFFYVAGSNVIHKFFDAKATLQTIQDERVTHLSIVPTQLIAMLNVYDKAKYDISSLKVLWYGGSPMPFEVQKKGIDVFGPIFAEGYGQSESGPAISHLSVEETDIIGKPEEEQKKLMSAGRPDIGVQVRIVNDKNIDVEPGQLGEIIIRSNHTMIEYWQKPEETKNTIIDGWVHTGDVGYYDEKGYIYITDRKKDMIITGGENVFPREVEEILYKHPSVLEATVIGIPDPYWVERVHAIIVLKSGMTATQEEIIAFCRKYLAGYKTPKSIEFVDSLPKNPAGKILKRELRDKYWKSSSQPK